MDEEDDVDEVLGGEVRSFFVGGGTLPPLLSRFNEEEPDNSQSKGTECNKY